MHSSTLYSKFTAALSWNAFLYFVHRCLSTVVVFVWYRTAPTATFSTWTTLLSAIFLILLWLDFGFRKSIARYAPIFTEHRAFRIFTRTVLLFQLTILFLAAPVFYYVLPYLTRFILHRDALLTMPLRMIAAGLFITEGLVEILRLLYHAHFLNKPFNILSTVARLLESTTTLLILVLLMAPPTTLLTTILSIKFFSSTCIIIAALIMLPLLYTTARHDIPAARTTAPLWPLWYRFALHSCMMWLSTGIKSLSERNFVIPTLTYTLGMEQANIFKLAQDGALFFERSLIKTIGTADTALLAHVEGKKRDGDMAFNNLTRRVAALCIPLCGILVFIMLQGRSWFHDASAFHIFLILTATYLLEVLISPYERILEVKQRYLLLWIAYLPYVLGLLALLSGRFTLDLITFVLMLQGIRLMSLLLMMGFGYWQYSLRFPIRFVLGWLIVSCGSAIGLWGLLHLFI